MTTLYICRGNCSSGKTTWANEQIRIAMAEGRKLINVNRDSLRFMAGLSKTPGNYEPTITFQQHTLIERGLQKGYDVISSDTNLRAKTVKDLAEIAVNNGAAVEVVDFDVPLDELIRRDKDRADSVGEEVIRNFYNKYCKNGFPKNPLDKIEAFEFEPYAYNPALPDAFVVDIDGTLANSNGIRSPYDYSKVIEDKPHYDVIYLTKILAEQYPIIIVSGRLGSCREDTTAWLKMNTVPFSELYMRRSDDPNRKDFIVKYEIYDQFIRPKYNIIGWIDDRKQVIDTMRNQVGLRVYDVMGNTF